MARRNASTPAVPGESSENTAILHAMQRMMELQQEHNQLMRVSMERAHETATRHAAVPAIGAPPRPGTVSDFRRLHPEVFAGTETYLQADQWLIKIEQLLQAARVADADRVDMVIIQLSDVAHIWWKEEVERLKKPIAWATFMEKFLAMFFPASAMIEMER